MYDLQKRHEILMVVIWYYTHSIHVIQRSVWMKTGVENKYKYIYFANRDLS